MGYREMVYYSVFTHFLITRFNIRIDGMGPEKIESPPLDEAWLTTRLRYFERYCAASVLAQSNRDFTWLIYFDSKTSPAFLDKLAHIKRDSPVIDFVLVDHFDDMLQDLRRRLDMTSLPYVISSRLDNDDMLSRDFIQLVQSAFVPEHSTLINFNSGFEYDVNRQLVKKWNQRFHNQFISLIESKQSGELLTVYGFPHWGPPTDAKVINIDKPAAWMHLRHTNNYSPNTYKGIPVFRSDEIVLFPIEKQRGLKTFLSTLGYSLQWFPRMLWRRLRANS